MKRDTNMTQGKIIPKVIAFALPLMLTSILQQLYSLADAVIVRHLIGVDAFAAIGADGTLLWIPENMLIGLAQGFGVVFAQYYGASQYGKLSGSMKIGLSLAAMTGTLLSILMLLLSNVLLRLINVPNDMRDNAWRYLISMLPFILAASLFNTAASFLRATGDSRTPLAAMLLSSILNIGLDYALVALTPLGIAGVGLATGIAQFAAFLICVCTIIKHKPNAEDSCGHVGLLLRMGLPSMLRNGVISLGGGIVQRLVNTYGIAMIAGYAASKKYFTMLQLCGSALESSAATFAGQTTGSGNQERLKQGIRYIALLVIISSVVTAVIAYIFADILIVFLLGNSDPEALACGIHALRWAAIFLPSLYLLCILRAFIQNMGYAMTAMASGFCELLTRVIACAVLPALIGKVSAYIVEETGWLVTLIYLCACLIIIFKRNRRGCKTA